MLKQLSACILILAIAAQTFNRLAIVVDYYTNTASYAKNCINKAKPMMHCNGHCQLMKKLNHEENKDQQNPERRAENKLEVLSSRSFFCNAAIPAFISVSTIKNNFSLVYTTTGCYLDIFHPPQA